MNTDRLNKAWEPLRDTFWRQLHRPLDDLVRDLSREGVNTDAIRDAIRAPRSPEDLRQVADLLLGVADALEA